MTDDAPPPPQVFPTYTPPQPSKPGFMTRKQSGPLFKMIKFMAKPKMKPRVSKPKKGLAKNRKIDPNFGV